MRARYWIITLSHERHPEQPQLPEAGGYIRGQLEIGTGGFRHWQFVFYAKNTISLRTVTTLFPGCHAEATRSQAALDYVSKDDTRVEGTSFQEGEIPTHRPTTDWHQILDSARNGNFDAIPPGIYLRYHATIHRLHTQCTRPIFRDTISAQLFVGPTGTGKSRRAWEEAGQEAYIKNPNTKWWDGYTGQTSVIIDEYTGTINLSNLLLWLDRYPCLIEFKGGACALQATKFWICSNTYPSDWYPEAKQEQLNALFRRLTIIQF